MVQHIMMQIAFYAASKRFFHVLQEVEKILNIIPGYILPCSLGNFGVYAFGTKLKESIYRSIHIAKHFWSEEEKDDPGLLIHFLKHLSVIFVSSSCMFASATCVCTVLISSSFCCGERFSNPFAALVSIVKDLKNI